MPFEFPQVPVLNPDTTPKYDLTTGKGRLNYLADQLAARQPVGFNMKRWETCAIGEAQKMDELVRHGIGRTSCTGDSLAKFFGVDDQVAFNLFGGYPRTVNEEVEVLRAAAIHAK